MARPGMTSNDNAGRTSGIGSVSLAQVVLLVLYAIVVAVLIVLPKFLDTVADLVDPISEMTRFIIAVSLGLVVAVVIIAMIALKATGSAETEAPLPVRPAVQRPPQSPTIPGFVPINPPSVAQIRPQVPEKPPQSVIIYPDLVEGGIFGDTFINISPSKTLKLRSMIVEPEHLN